MHVTGPSWAYSHSSLPGPDDGAWTTCRVGGAGKGATVGPTGFQRLRVEVHACPCSHSSVRREPCGHAYWKWTGTHNPTVCWERGELGRWCTALMTPRSSVLGRVLSAPVPPQWTNAALDSVLSPGASWDTRKVLSEAERDWPEGGRFWKQALMGNGEPSKSWKAMCSCTPTYYMQLEICGTGCPQIHVALRHLSRSYGQRRSKPWEWLQTDPGWDQGVRAEKDMKGSLIQTGAGRGPALKK